MSKNVLITGITGMVGSHLLDFVIDNTDWNIWGMLRWRSPLDNITQHIGRINNGDRVRLVYADLRDTMAVQNAVIESKPDIVFHLAAQNIPERLLTLFRYTGYKHSGLKGCSGL